MSFTFDIMQQAISWLEERLDGDAQTADVIFYIREILDDLHEYSHEHHDILNRVTGVGPSLLETAMRYEHDGDRKIWLSRRKSTSSGGGQ